MAVTSLLGRVTHWMLIVLALLLAGPVFTLAFGRVSVGGDWRAASHRSAGLAPDPAATHEAVVQVYAARAFGWRGAFAEHTWLVAKGQGDQRYTRYDVIGWYAGGGRSVVSISQQRAPDGEWYGASPRVIADLRGAEAQAVIDKLPQAVASYPYPSSYTVWPGPNSNTFVAYLGRSIPQLHLAMPSTAIGKDFVPLSNALTRTASGSGYQMSLLGLLSVSVGRYEGFELNVLGLVVGIDVLRPALKLPGIGRVPGDT